MDRPAAPTNLRCEYIRNPVGIDESRPRLSWWVNDSRRGAIQTAYQIQVATSEDGFDRSRIWDSGRVGSSDSIQIAYSGPSPSSRRRYFWRVRTWGRTGAASPWGETAFWEMGLVEREDWSAAFIGLEDGRAPAPCPFFRRSFRAENAVRRARVYATALGVYELRINGTRIGDDVFAPGWTDYRKRAMYRTHDITNLILKGENAAGAIVGPGWYGSPLMATPRFHFGDPPVRFMAQIEIEYTNGKVDRIVTDESWKAATGPILLSEIYAGERYDARKRLTGWDLPGYDDGKWGSAAYYGRPRIELNAQTDPPIRVTEERVPVSVRRLPGKKHVFDFGQNIVGVCRLSVRGRAGTTVKLRHAEFLNPDNTVSVENLRSAEAIDTYTLSGKGDETWTPRFTYHGFRYVEITGFPGTPDLTALTGLVFHTAPGRTGELDTSSPLVNKLQRNIVQGQRGNMHSVVTDCPQRDERLGWMGDAQAFAPTACFNMDMAGCLTKFSRDMRDAVSADGSYCDVSPRVPFAPQDGAPAWADAGILVPWTVYRFYGDRRILEREYETMKAFNDFVERNNPDGLWLRRRGNDYGDWVPAGVVTDKDPLSTIIYHNSTRIMGKIARVLGKTRDATVFDARAARTRSAFIKRHMRRGEIRSGTQTLNAMALATGILPPVARPKAIRNLIRDIRRRNDHLSTGFLGTPVLLPALADSGHVPLALKLLLNRDYPSWGYMIAKGATTIWERWNSDTEGPAMNSRNHFAFGSVGEWMFRYLAGIDPVESSPGFGRILIRPCPDQPGGELDRVRARYESIRGVVETEWRTTPSAFFLNVTVPANVRATVILPVPTTKGVTESGAPLARAKGVTRVRVSNGRATCEIGAGTYSFAMAPTSGISR